MYKLNGKIIDNKIEDINTSKGDYKKMLFTIEEINTDFTNRYQFEIFGEDAIEVHKTHISNGNYISIDFYIKSNEWKDKFFYTLVPKRITLEATMKEETPF